MTSDTANTGEQKRLAALVGKTLGGKYKILSLIERGGMGAVYRARQLNLDRTVAVKVIREEYLFFPNVIEKFMEEARKGSAIHHPNAVEIYDFDHDADTDRLYLVMKLLEGKTLKQVIQECVTIPWDRTVGIAQQICGVLAEAHDKGIVHRDLKPANIMVETWQGSAWGWVTVMDFGIAKAFSDPQGMTQTGILMGTPYYMSPEQVEGKGDLDGRADIYSLGIILYEMLTGKVPFESDSTLSVMIKHITEALPPLRDTYPGLDIPKTLEAIILRCLEKNRQHRFRSAGELLHALRELNVEGTPASTGKQTTAMPEETQALERVARELFLLTPCPACGQTEADTQRFTCPRCGREHLCVSHRTEDGSCDACARRTWRRLVSWVPGRRPAEGKSDRVRARAPGPGLAARWKEAAAGLRLPRIRGRRRAEETPRRDRAAGWGATLAARWKQAAAGLRLPRIRGRRRAEETPRRDRAAGWGATLAARWKQAAAVLVLLAVFAGAGATIHRLTARSVDRAVMVDVSPAALLDTPAVPGPPVVDEVRHVRAAQPRLRGEFKSLPAPQGETTGPASVRLLGMPRGTTLSLDGETLMDRPGVLEAMEPGWVLLEASRDGYESWIEMVPLEQGTTLHVTVSADGPGEAGPWIEITGPDQGAEIHLNERFVGTVPVTLMDVEPGWHLVKIAREDRESWFAQLWLLDDERHVLEVPALEARRPMGSILLAGIPDGAEVSLNRTTIFTSPERPLHVHPGTYLLEVKKAGFRPWSRTVAVAEREQVSLRVAPLAPVKRKARILVSGEPHGAKIYLNGRYVGNVPRTLGGLDAGSHILNVVHKGHHDWLQEVILKQGQDLRVTVVLNPLGVYGRVRLTGTHGARVYLDGQHVATIPQTIQKVPAGTHVLDAEMEGYREHREHIVVEADTTLHLEILLKPQRVRTFIDKIKPF